MATRAEAAARKAIALDETVAEGHAALGDILRDQYEWKAAEKEYLRAVAINPTLAEAHDGYAILLSIQRRHDEAIAEIKRMQERDPLSLLAAIDAGAMYYNAGHYPEAIKAFQEAAKLDPATPMTSTWMGIVNGASGRFPEAIHDYESAMTRGDLTPATKCYYVYSLARNGLPDAALRILDALRGSHAFVPPTGLAIAYTGLNRSEDAIQSLEQAFRARDPMLQYLDVEPHFKGIRDDPRFRNLVGRIGLSL
jgi:serine/threonine-protein kinase